jgi:hypothetical protein
VLCLERGDGTHAGDPGELGVHELAQAAKHGLCVLGPVLSSHLALDLHEVDPADRWAPRVECSLDDPGRGFLSVKTGENGPRVIEMFQASD